MLTDKFIQEIYYEGAKTNNYALLNLIAGYEKGEITTEQFIRALIQMYSETRREFIEYAQSTASPKICP